MPHTFDRTFTVKDVAMATSRPVNTIKTWLDGTDFGRVQGASWRRFSFLEVFGVRVLSELVHDGLPVSQAVQIVTDFITGSEAREGWEMRLAMIREVGFETMDLVNGPILVVEAGYLRPERISIWPSRSAHLDAVLRHLAALVSPSAPSRIYPLVQFLQTTLLRVDRLGGTEDDA